MKYIIFALFALLPALSFADAEYDIFAKSIEGKSGKEYNETLQKLSADGNPYARFEIAKETVKIKGKEEVGERMLKYLYENGMRDAGLVLYYYYIESKSKLYNLHTAAKLLEKMSKNGDTQAMIALGAVYCIGEGVPVDYNKAKFYLKAALEKNDRRAAPMLGSVYVFEKNYEEAVPLLKEGMNAGDLNAIDNLADLYEKGLGVEKDYITSYALSALRFSEYKKIHGRDDDDRTTIQRLARLHEKLSYSDRSEAYDLSAKLSERIFKNRPQKDRLGELSN